MKKVLSILLVFNFLLTADTTKNFSHTFQGYIEEVIKKQNSNERNNIYLKLISSEDSSSYYVDDFYLVFIIEHTHKVLLSEFAEKQSKPEIGLRLENIKLKQRHIRGNQYNFITGMEKIFPNYPESDRAYQYSDLNPGIPEEDYYHRFVTVPVSYDNPEMGEFKLYYELCSDFDETKPTVIIPTDGQNTLSQVGMADKYKDMFDLDYNTVTYEYRGMYTSSIPAVENKNTAWNTIYKILNTDNVIQDIERIRRDLPGKRKIYILGGSGTAMIGLKYTAQYPENVKRAYLMSFFKDARGSSESRIRFFKEFIDRNDLKESYISAIENFNKKKHQILFLLQRLLYFDKEAAKKMVIELSQNKLDLYKKYTKMLGTVNYFMESARKYKPWSVVFMYETNINTTDSGIYNINYPFYKIADPLREARKNIVNKDKDLFDIDNLSNVDTEILLVAGTLDQVAPVNQLQRIHDELPNSQLAVFEAYHCLQSTESSKKNRNKLANLFFKYGHTSPEVNEYLHSPDLKGKFIKIVE